MRENNLAKLPIGISDFGKIRREGYLYIDKTGYIYRMLSTGMYYFLSRPRRFGKSLLLSTLYYLFKGKRELFDGLYIYHKEGIDWREYPVIMLDFNRIESTNSEILRERLINRLKEIGQEEGLLIEESRYLKDAFAELIEKLYRKYGREVVLLIDEYDKAIVDHVGRGEEELQVAKANRDLLRSFYGTLKAADVVMRTKFVLLTGITKFSKVSLFSELNNLLDITMNSEFNSLLGITEQEVEAYLMPHIKAFSQEKGMSYEALREALRDYYNGYRFSQRQERVYNPFSLFSALRNRSITNYWFETGTPSYLVNLIKERNIYIPEYEEFEADEFMFSSYDIESLQILPLMFQSGYLTIKDYDERTRLYTLSYPNREVKESFARSLFREITGLYRETKYAKIGKALDDGDIEEAVELAKSIFAEIPYVLERKDRTGEEYYQTVFYLILTASGVGVRTEVLNYRGRIDMVVETRRRFYIIEFKCDQSSEAAIAQIKEKGYAEAYRGKGKEVWLVGINFGKEKRNVTEWKAEKFYP